MNLLFTLDDYPDYAIDKDGNVWRITASSRRWKNRPLPFRMQTYVIKSKGGDLGVDLVNKHGDRERVRVAPLVCNEFHGASFGRRVRFLDGDNSNLRATNLMWVGPCRIPNLSLNHTAQWSEAHVG